MNQVVVKNPQLMMPVGTGAPAPLDELMLAMDVVDTLRHRELMLEREVTADDRDQQLLVRLREIYTAQGITVTDDVLEQGVKALREERFVYTAPAPGFGRSLALLYVSRGRWGKWVGAAVGIIAGAVLALTLHDVMQSRTTAALPGELQSAYQVIVSETKDPKALERAQQTLSEGQAALSRRDYGSVGAAVGELRGLDALLEQQYELRIVSRPRERSGIERFSGDNPSGRNYYLIVEAIAPNGAPLTIPVRNEENGRTVPVRKWGLRVDEATYDRVKADKLDDGVIENAVVGAKHRGELDPEYSVATTGAAITKW
jgi:uncharacterized protein DUF6384